MIDMLVTFVEVAGLLVVSVIGSPAAEIGTGPPRRGRVPVDDGATRKAARGASARAG